MITDDLMNACREMVSRGVGVEDIVATLRQRGLSKVQTIKVLFDLRLADAYDAKKLVHDSPAWADVRERDEEFHRKLDELGGGSDP